MDDELRQKLFIYFLVVGLGAMLIGTGLIVHELFQAKKFCKSIDGQFAFSPFNKISYKCNSIPIYHYEDGWSFDKNYSIENYGGIDGNR